MIYCTQVKSSRSKITSYEPRAETPRKAECHNFALLILNFELLYMPTPQEIWEAALGELELELSRANFNTWLRNTKVLEKKDEVMVIGVPDSFTKEWLENKYYDKIFTVLKGIAREVKKVQYEIKTDLFRVPPPAPSQERTPLAPPLAWTQPGLNKSYKSELNPRYQLSNFVVGPFNELAYAATLGILKNPGEKFNPFFLYGGIGLGKTHLIQAMGNVFLQSGEYKVKYISADRFSSEYIQAVKNGSIQEFKESYHKFNVLIIDDVQFFAGKEKSQEIFFHTFNHLYQKNHQIILSSDRPARAIAMLQARLRSRFEGGMIADIANPDMESRVAILSKKLEEKGATLPYDTIEMVARKIDTNIRELQGALNTILNYCDLHGSLSKETLSTLLARLSALNKKSTSFERIVEIVTQFYNIDPSLLLTTTRRKDTSFPRQIVMYLLRKELEYSFPSIGRKLGGKDHSTIMYACKKIDDMLKESDELRKDLEVITDQIYNF